MTVVPERERETRERKGFGWCGSKSRSKTIVSVPEQLLVAMGTGQQGAEV